MTHPRVHVYAVCWNEVRILPYFLRHYETIADRIVVYDDGSDDGSLELLGAHPKVTVRKLPGSWISPEIDRRDVKAHAWKESRDEADWVIACDVDEFLHHSDLFEFLAGCKRRGITLPIPRGYQLFAEWFPTTIGQIYEELRFGFADPEYSKPLLFDPRAIREIGYDAGCHRADPVGEVVAARLPGLRLLHAKFLGLSHVKARYHELAKRCTQHDRDQGWDYQYFWTEAELQQKWSNYRERAYPFFETDGHDAGRIGGHDDQSRHENFADDERIRDLAVFVISWNRPGFLKQTLDSLFAACRGLKADIFVVDNGSEDGTRRLIVRDQRLAGYRLFDANFGINGALELAVPHDLPLRYRNILISDADMTYQRSLSLGISRLKESTSIGAISYQHSPEHPEIGFESDGRNNWVLKESERGCALLLRSEDFQAVRPLPIEKLRDFDWWIMRDAPNSLSSRARRVAVLPGGARHLGWRAGDSTWQPTEIPEFAEFRQ